MTDEEVRRLDEQIEAGEREAQRLAFERRFITDAAGRRLRLPDDPAQRYLAEDYVYGWSGYPSQWIRGWIRRESPARFGRRTKVRYDAEEVQE
jgi:hypothetical protein